MPGGYPEIGIPGRGGGGGGIMGIPGLGGVVGPKLALVAVEEESWLDALHYD